MIATESTDRRDQTFRSTELLRGCLVVRFFLRQVGPEHLECALVDLLSMAEELAGDSWN